MTDQLSPVLPAIETQPVILLVEDDSNDALIAERAIKQSGIARWIIRLHDGEEAIKYLSGQAPYNDRKTSPLPVLVLLDLKMPRVSGFDVLAWIHNQPDLASIPVVVLTGSGLARDRSEAEKLGAVGYEVKPVDFNDLLDIVGNIGTRWLKPTEN
jgi:CheY-like chemotaxis protein